MKTLTCAVAFSVMMGCVIGWATDASAEKSFFCKATVASIGDRTPTSLGGPLVYDLGIVGSCTDFQWARFFNSKCEGPATSACSAKAARDNNFNSAAFWCALGVPNGSTIRAYAAVGGKGKYQAVQTGKILTNIPAVTNTVYDCDGMPGTWLDKPSSGNGNHARCVRASCNAVSGVPAAPSWVRIGNTAWTSAGAAWLTDDKGNVWYGAPARATTKVVRAAQCHW